MESLYRNKYFKKLPLINLLLAAVLGTVIRYYVYKPFPGFNFVNWLQVHSHVMFLGWVTLALFVFILGHLKETGKGKTDNVLILFQVSVLAMFISFPSEGYGPMSIFFLSLTMIAGVLIFMYVNKSSREEKNTGWLFIRSGFLFMILSSLGPLALGPITVMGLKNTEWYNYAIYFYLHFQYNGWFFLAITGLILLRAGTWESGNRQALRRSCRILNVSILLTFFLSVLGHGNSYLFNIVGGAGAVVQLTVIAWLAVKFIRSNENVSFFRGTSALLLKLSFLSLGLKLVLQVFSAFPFLTDFILNNRNVVIAYLHLVLIGFVSFSLLWFYLEQHHPERDQRYRGIYITLLISGFFLNEFALLISVTGGIMILIPVLLFVASLVMVAGIAGITILL